MGYIYLVHPTIGIPSLQRAVVAPGDSAAWSPAGDRLAILNGGVVTMDPDGSDKWFSSVSCVDEGPIWDPDGDRVAIQTCDGLSLLDLDTDEVSVVPNADGLHPTDWSPDGDWILAWRQTSDDPDADLWKIRPDGSDLTRILDRDGHQREGRWSPDGSTVMFGDWDFASQANTRIAKVSPDGGAVSFITDGTFDAGASWSPSGDEIVLNTSLEGGGLFTMAADGSGIERIPQVQPVGSAAWQPAQVTLDTSSSLVDAGTQVALHVEIAAPGTDQPSVSVQRRPAGGTWTTITTTDVDGTGSLDLTTRVMTQTAFRAIWEGDASHPGGTSVSVTVRARAVVEGHLSRYFARRGQFHLYHEGRRIYYTGEITPRRPGERMCFLLQIERPRQGSWRTVFDDCFQMDKGTKVTVYMLAAEAGVVGRIRAYVKKKPDLLNDHADWAAFKVVR